MRDICAETAGEHDLLATGRRWIGIEGAEIQNIVSIELLNTIEGA